MNTPSEYSKNTPEAREVEKDLAYLERQNAVEIKTQLSSLATRLMHVPDPQLESMHAYVFEHVLIRKALADGKAYQHKYAEAMDVYFEREEMRDHMEGQVIKNFMEAVIAFLSADWTTYNDILKDALQYAQYIGADDLYEGLSTTADMLEMYFFPPTLE